MAGKKKGVALSNERIVRCQDGQVTFRYRDSTANNMMREMTVSAEEFIRRFLLHVLPKRFVRIRHYGLLSNRNRKTKLAYCQSLLGAVEPDAETKPSKRPWQDLVLELTGTDPMRCPRCGDGRMRTTRELLPSSERAPPGKWRQSA